MLCELLPVSIPSLVVSVMIASLGGLEFAVSRRIHSVLRCDNIKVSTVLYIPHHLTTFLTDPDIPGGAAQEPLPVGPHQV